MALVRAALMVAKASVQQKNRQETEEQIRGGELSQSVTSVRLLKEEFFAVYLFFC